MLVAKINGVTFKHALPQNVAKKMCQEIETARVLTNTARVLLTDNVAAGDKIGEKTARKLLLSRRESWLTSLIAANARLPLQRRATLDRCLKLAAGPVPWGQSREKVSVRARLKPSGGVRAIYNFGLEHRARQHSINGVMGGYHHPRPFQLQGHYKAITRTRALLTSGFTYVASLDVTNFFGSFEFEKLAPELPLPVEVVKHAVVGRQLRIVLDRSTETKHSYHLPALHQQDLVSFHRTFVNMGLCSMGTKADETLKVLSDALREECKKISAAHKANIYLSGTSMGIRTERSGKKIVSADQEDQWEYTIERPRSSKSKRRYMIKLTIKLSNFTG
ncbi:hypothetical protein [Methylobacterium oxalidis]|uniref:Reverse transcriptase domain-containing protein n=1 Tax=Methylobacterium oxalidis TaxID=944322 RepID=A0A512JBG4_9HYPH|nr:hypothetical protein [Methylobacterium oxalidis]GEP07215.1 hypothetical protein MOX02_52530 [Methylobacterium oxalidis]GJE31921.1 hypothetical protein LDDCCGHA_2103 [Methylobacterium oxalidis]GLS67635.1 hypothetical protein GCM10007888_60190 [Methylobacterium oxalidis]